MSDSNNNTVATAMLVEMGQVKGQLSALMELIRNNHAATQLRIEDLSQSVGNPKPPCGSWLGYMRMALRQLVTCDCVALLEGWERSRGARIEARLAGELDLFVLPAASILQGPRGG